MTGPLVSIVIPYFNHGEYLHTAVQSALAAWTGPSEILIVDDGAVEPGAAAFLRNACRLSERVRVIRRENGGLSAARNTGLAEAKGDYVQFLDSDDALYPGKIDAQIAHLRARPGLVASISHYSLSDRWFVDFPVDHDSIGRFPLTIDSFLMAWERGFSVPIHTALFRAEALSRQAFDTRVYGKEDWIFWCDLLRRFPDGLGYLPILGAVYRQHGQGMTRGFARMGDSYRAAVTAIEAMWGADHPGFRPAADLWFERFYRPRMAHEPPAPAASRPAAPHAPASPAAPAPRSSPRIAHDGPTLSVIVPVFNHFDHLAACLSSALDQPEVLEVMVIDDASSDARVEPFLRRWATAEPRLVYRRNDRNLGISATQNRASELARGDFLGFLDCDDALEPGAVAIVLDRIRAEPADYYFTDRLDIDEAGRPVRTARYGGYPWLAPSGDIAADLALGMVASHWKVIRRQAYLEAGGSDEAFAGIQDWDLALRLIGTARFVHVPLPLYRHRVHPGAVTSGHRIAQMWLTNRARRRHLTAGRAAGAGSGPASVVTALRDPDTARALVRRRLGGEILTFAAQGRALATVELDLLREFNALFDRIAVADTEAVALLGYLWDHRVLHPASSDQSFPCP